MAGSDQDIRREIGEEREKLAEAVDTLRARLKAKLPVAAAGAVGLGFVASGGLRATARLLLGRRR